LAAIVIKEIVARNPEVPVEEIEDVIFGCANQAGEDNRNVARMGLLLAGLPYKIGGETVNRFVLQECLLLPMLSVPLQQEKVKFILQVE
jgi:acetyl-CoA acetyltransferase